MSVKFNGRTIPGTHGEVLETPPQTVTIRRYFWGNRGMTEKVGGSTGRPVRVDIILHDDWATYAAAARWIEQNLDRMSNLHGTLKITDDNTPRTLQRCTFEGFERRSPIMKDEAGTIEADANNWFCEGTLHFFQVRV